MKKEIKEVKKDNLTTTYYKITKSPEDGFVPEKEMHPASNELDFENRGKYHLGYSKSIGFTTDNPKITRPFVTIFCGFFAVLGILLLLAEHWFLGIIFTFVGIEGVIGGNIQISKIQKRKNENQNNQNSENTELTKK